MKSFIQKYEQDVMGALSGFDRLVFRGTLRRKVKRLQIPPPRSKCLRLYHYFFHPQCGFMSARLQTWFPLTIQVWSTASAAVT